MFKNSLIFIVLVGALTLTMGTPANAWSSKYIFPHMVDGGYIYGTELWFHNVQDTPTRVVLNFFDDNRWAWDIDLRSFEGIGGHQSTFNFTLQPYQSVYFFTGCIDPLKVGWAYAETTQPVNVSASFTYYNFNSDPPQVIWSAGVLPAPAATAFSFAADVSPVEDAVESTKVDMGFAIVNPGTETPTSPPR